MYFPGTQQMKLYQPNEFSYRKQYLDLDKEMLFFLSIFLTSWLLYFAYY